MTKPVLIKEDYNKATEHYPSKVPSDLELICMVSASHGGSYGEASQILEKVDTDLTKKASEAGADYVFGIEYKIVPLFIASVGVDGAVNSNYVLLAQGDAYRKRARNQ